MANRHIVGRPVRFRPPVYPPVRSISVRRPVIYWPAVALAAATGALFVGGVIAGIALRPARTVHPVAVALAAPAIADLASPLPEADAAPPTDPAPPPPAAASASLAVSAMNQDNVACRYDPPPLPPPPAAPVAAPSADPPAPPPAPPAEKKEAPPPAAVCQTFNTSVEFAVSPTAAEKQAARDGKLVFLLHVSGDFEDDAFT